MILEPAVTLTDYAIAVEGVVLAVLILRRPKSPARFWFAILFAFVAIAALLGGTVHGFMPDPAAHIYAITWSVTLVSIGVIALAAAMAGANSGWGKRVRNGVLAAVIIVFAVYCGEVLFVRQEYRLAIAVYVPAMVLLFVSFFAAYLREQSVPVSRKRRILVGVAGVLLTFVAAGIQRSQLMLAGLDHNAIYHIVQGIALVAIYVGALGLMSTSRVAD